MTVALTEKPDLALALQHHTRFWRGEGLVVNLHAWKPGAERSFRPAPNLETQWLDPAYRVDQALWQLEQVACLADALPYIGTNLGPGSLGTFLGAEGRLAEDTIWYVPCIQDPEAVQGLTFQAEGSRWWTQHINLINGAISRSEGRCLVGMPDLIENLDTLAALRGEQNLLIDLIERPAWVTERLAEINQAFFQAFDRLFALIKDPLGGNVFSAFSIWGPGKTAKIQCDFSAMISPRMFRRFALPFFIEQCRFLDYALYHLDGTTALQHVDSLLEIPGLHAIEWTPQAGKPEGGSPEWYDLYRRIKAGGKGVQVMVEDPEGVIPLLDAIGPQGTYVFVTRILEMEQAERLLKALEPYYRD